MTLNKIWRIIRWPLILFGVNLFIAPWYALYAPGLDKIIHIAGGFLIVNSCMFWWRESGNESKIKNLGFSPMLMVCIGIAGTAGILWEAYEMTFDLIFQTINQIGLYDTMGDLLADLMGGLIWFLFNHNKK